MIISCNGESPESDRLLMVMNNNQLSIMKDITTGLRNKNDYQILCTNCNFAKKDKEHCPHKYLPVIIPNKESVITIE